MLNKQQIKLVQVAVGKAGVRLPKDDSRYRLLLSQYKRSDGSAVTNCKQLTRPQLEDILAICEALGWRHPGKEIDFYRKRVDKGAGGSSFAQQAAILKLTEDLGWTAQGRETFILRMTDHRAKSVTVLSTQEASQIIEGLKAILSGRTGRTYKDLSEVKDDFMESVKDDQKQTG